MMSPNPLRTVILRCWSSLNTLLYNIVQHEVELLPVQVKLRAKVT